MVLSPAVAELDYGVLVHNYTSGTRNLSYESRASPLVLFSLDLSWPAYHQLWLETKGQVVVKLPLALLTYQGELQYN